MRHKLNLLCFLLVLASTWMSAQDALIKRADKSFERYDYSNAAELYEKAIENGYEGKNAYINLADAHYLNANYSDAADWFGRLAEKDASALDQEHIHRYALALKSIGNYEESDKWMIKLSNEEAVADVFSEVVCFVEFTKNPLIKPEFLLYFLSL